MVANITEDAILGAIMRVANMGGGEGAELMEEREAVGQRKNERLGSFNALSVGTAVEAAEREALNRLFS